LTPAPQGAAPRTRREQAMAAGQSSKNMEEIMNYIAGIVARSGLLKRDLDYHLLRTGMVIIFAWFGYDKWFEAEIRGLLPLITHGPLIFWTIPVLGIHGTAILLGTSEWTFGSLLLLGFWSKKAGMLGALGSTFTFVATLTILPFVPDAWDAGAGGFPAMTMNSAFLLKDLVLLLVSLYLLKQDAVRVIAARRPASQQAISPSQKLAA
jgi:uncharacterized membrane protein YkgB